MKAPKPKYSLPKVLFGMVFLWLVAIFTLTAILVLWHCIYTPSRELADLVINLFAIQGGYL